MNTGWKYQTGQRVIVTELNKQRNGTITSQVNNWNGYGYYVELDEKPIPLYFNENQLQPMVVEA